MPATTIGVSRLLSQGTSKGARTPDVREPRAKLADEICLRQRRLESARNNQDNTWDDTDMYITSRRSHYNVGYIRGDSPKDEGGSSIYDDAASDALQKFADNFQAQTANPIIDDWAARFRGPLKKDTQAMKWIDEVKEVVRYEEARSSFFEEYNECVQDVSSHGIATMAGPEWNWKEGILEYRTFHPREIFCSFNILGRPILWHQKFPITGRQILEEFPDAIDKETQKELWKRIDDNPFREFMCIHAIYKRKERDVKSLAATEKEWASVWVLETEKLVLDEGGYDDLDMPMDSWIWRKGSGGLYCFCPASDALYSVMMENDAAKALMKSVQLSVEPPLVMTEGVKGNVNFFPLGQTILKNPTDKLEAFKFPTNFQIGVEQINDLRSQLTKKLRADIFTLMSDAPHQMTAFQASGIQGEKASGLIPIVTRSSSQMIIPKKNKTVRELAKAGRLPKPPSSIIQYASSPVDIELMGPVSTAAKRYLSQQGFNALMAQLGEVKNVAPEQFMMTLMEGFQPDEFRKFLIESNSAPQKLNMDDDQLMQIRQARMQAQQAQQKLQGMQQLADAANKGGKAPEPGSPTESIMKGRR